MTSGHTWARTFTVTNDDLDFLTGLLLDRETPLTTQALTAELVEHRLQLEAEQLSEQFRGVRLFNPSETYTVGQRVLFHALEDAIGVVEAVRPGNNPAYPPFHVMQVSLGGTIREFAFDYPDHPLGAGDGASLILPGGHGLTAQDILSAAGKELTAKVDAALRAHPDLVTVAGLWFPRDLILEVNEGYLNLAEAVLDINAGGPMETAQVLEEIGALGSAPRELQIFSMNDALDRDGRFDEVGPSGKVFWFLKRLEPAEVLTTPPVLRYAPVEFEPDLLSAEMWALVEEIRDEWSDLETSLGEGDPVAVNLIYPHRRAGTLPLNADMQTVFPTARRSPRIAFTLVDAQDGEQFPGWVVRQERYVFGLTPIYRKHRMPVGAVISVRADEEPGQIIVDFNAHRPRTEYVPIITPHDGRITFDYQKRSIGAEYDDQMILGSEDVTAVDALFQAAQQSRRPLPAIVNQLMHELGRSTPQGTVHAKTIYSAVNVLRRTPPEPVLAALADSEDFEHLGNNHWRIRARS